METETPATSTSDTECFSLFSTLGVSGGASPSVKKKCPPNRKSKPGLVFICDITSCFHFPQKFLTLLCVLGHLQWKLFLI